MYNKNPYGAKKVQKDCEDLKFQMKLYMDYGELELNYPSYILKD